MDLLKKEALLSYPFQRYQNHFTLMLGNFEKNYKIIPFKKGPGSRF
jgi:hypothetical protein